MTEYEKQSKRLIAQDQKHQQAVHDLKIALKTIKELEGRIILKNKIIYDNVCTISRLQSRVKELEK